MQAKKGTTIQQRLMKKLRNTLGTLAAIVVAFAVADIGGAAYLLGYSLNPDPERTDTAQHLRQLYDLYPEARGWMDSLQRVGALRDTFVTAANGERQHAYYISNGSQRTAVVLHGWRDNALKFLYLARLYDRLLGYNVVMPELHAHGLSNGETIQMGWLDRKDVRHWMELFRTDTMVVHGVSMGAATAMMLSGDEPPAGISDLRIVEDCGYTSVDDEFRGELHNQFGLPPFPLLPTASLLCRLLNGWDFEEASALRQVEKSQLPMLFIHGDSDTFVPTEMVYRLYAAKPGKKELWVTRGSGHAQSYLDHREEYVRHVADFLNRSFQ